MMEKIFYHIYPLGFCGAPLRNDFVSPAGTGLRSLANRIPELVSLGINAVYLGPLFESVAHGYDTLDYYYVDRRLGTNKDLRNLVRAYHEQGIMVVLDAVLNHTGRHFFAFKDLQEKGSASPYRDWFSSVDFTRPSPQGDPFWYEGWNGCYDLVKLNGHSPAVREHLFGAVAHWIREFDIDGLRLDAADQLLPDFMDELARRCRSLKPEFWLMGEVVHGDYRRWATENRLDSVTNYELYKSLWSSFNDRNFFELSWTLGRQFGPAGMYRHLGLYNFLDNHDVNRVASTLKHKAHLFPLYGLLFTIPGIPAIYYGSEFGIQGERTCASDQPLRPVMGVPGLWENRPLVKAITSFITIRKNTPALQQGTFRQLYLSHEQFAFMREITEREVRDSSPPVRPILVAVNASEKQVCISIPRETLQSDYRSWKDLLTGEVLQVSDEGVEIPLYSSWLRILQGRGLGYPLNHPADDDL
jgi:glycosidase